MFRTLILTGLLALAVPVALAAAQKPDTAGRCDTRSAILDFLSSRYAEEPVAMGVAEDGGLVEVLASREGSTFTIIVTSPDGRTCMVAAGEGWEQTVERSPPHHI